MAELTRHLVDLEGFRVLNKRRYKEALFERRLMAVFVCVAVLSILCLFVSVSTTSWVIIEHLHSGNVTSKFHLGIWGEWRTDYNKSQMISRVWIPHFPTPPERRRLLNHDLPHYYRTQAVFSAITLALMISSISFALYSFGHHRYMFKRLAAGLFIFVAMCIFVVIEVLVHSVDEWKNMTEQQEHSDDYFAGAKYGYSVYLAWFIFITYLFGAFIFMCAGRKQKGSRAATLEFEVEDRPINLGRF